MLGDRLRLQGGTGFPTGIAGALAVAVGQTAGSGKDAPGGIGLLIFVDWYMVRVKKEVTP